MNADQVIEGIGNVVAAAKPAEEYCLFWSDYWWWMCMTKTEWASWAQAVFVAVALLSPLIRQYYIKRVNKKIVKTLAEEICNNIVHLQFARKKLKDDNFETDAANKYLYLSMSWDNLIDISHVHGQALFALNPSMHLKLFSLQDNLRKMIDEFSEDLKAKDWSNGFELKIYCLDFSSEIDRKIKQFGALIYEIEGTLGKKVMSNIKNAPLRDE